MSDHRRAKELADEILRPLGLRHADLRDESKRDLVGTMKKVVIEGRENELYDKQKGWEHDPTYKRTR